MTRNVAIKCLATGVPGLDALLGGGLPEFSLNVIAGTPGCGKTTLAHQIMFALTNPQRRALYFTVLGEPTLKMLRYQQQFTFFDADKIYGSIRFVNLWDEARVGDVNQILARIQREVEAYAPALIFVDSFRSAMLAIKSEPELSSMQLFVQELAVHLASSEATTFLVGEYVSAEIATNAVFAVADGLIWLSQNIHRDSMVRKIEIKKVRGQVPLTGLHTFRITESGVQAFPRAIVGAAITPPSAAVENTAERLSVGVPRLDDMLGGGLPHGYSLLVAGPSGSGKTVLATSFLREGARLGESGIVVAFEKIPSQSLSPALADLVRAGQVGVIDPRRLDLDMDVTLHEMLRLIDCMQARRVVIDSLSGFELALTPTPSENFRESLYRMVAVLTGRGLTVLMTSELEDRYTDLRFSPSGTAFLTDAIIVQRYIELKSRLRRVIAVVKVRGSAHSNEPHLFEINEDGFVIGDPLVDYEGLLGGQPALVNA